MMEKGGVLSMNAHVVDMRQELDDHLEAINENTEELEHTYSYILSYGDRLTQLERKISLLMETLQQANLLHDNNKYRQVRITQAEQEIFMVLYEKDRALDYDSLESDSRRNRSFVRNCINSMIEKGIPIRKHLIGKKPYFHLNHEFKELQTKKNILQLEKTLTLDCFDQGLVE